MGVGVAKPLGHLKHNRTNIYMQLCKVCLTETINFLYHYFIKDICLDEDTSS